MLCFPQTARGFFTLFTATILTALLGLSEANAARSVTLGWDPNTEPDISGYRLKFGTASGSYSQTVNVGNVTSTTIANLNIGNTYFFTVTAVNTLGVESIPSTETSITVVNLPPNVAISSPEHGDHFNASTTVSFVANAADADGAVSKVEFFVGTTKIGEDTSVPFTLNWNNAQTGDHQIKAVAYDNDGAVVNSQQVLVSIKKLAMSSLQKQLDGSMKFTVSGAVGRTNNVYVSSDLQNWTLLTTAVNTTGEMEITDLQAAAVNRRFYKIVAN